MFHRVPLGAAALVLMLLGGCAESQLPQFRRAPAPVPAAQPVAPPPAATVEAPTPPRTSPEPAAATDDLPEAPSAPSAPSGPRLGQTTASLGDATEPGLWIATNLVSSPQSGRIENAGTGQSASVELRPLTGEGGSQLSISAMQAIGASLTDIPTVNVYAN